MPFQRIGSIHRLRSSLIKQHTASEMPAASALSHLFGQIKNLLMRLRAQLLAALCASALQNITTVRSRHTLAEPVNLAALSLFGLIGTYHILHLFLPNIVMAHNAKLTFPIIEEAPPKCQELFFMTARSIQAAGNSRPAGSIHALSYHALRLCRMKDCHFSITKQNGFSMRSFCQKVIACR